MCVCVCCVSMCVCVCGCVCVLDNFSKGVESSLIIGSRLLPSRDVCVSLLSSRDVCLPDVCVSSRCVCVCLREMCVCVCVRVSMCVSRRDVCMCVLLSRDVIHLPRLVSLSRVSSSRDV